MQALGTALYNEPLYLMYADRICLIFFCFTFWYSNFEFVLFRRLDLPAPHHAALSHCPVKPWRGTLRLRQNPPFPYGLLLWAAWSRLLLVPPSKYRCLVCGLVALQFCEECWSYSAFASSFSLWHQRPCPVWGFITLYTTLERFCVALLCHTEVFIFDVPGPPRDVR